MINFFLFTLNVFSVSICSFLSGPDTVPDSSLSANCRILHAYWLWLLFLFISFHFLIFFSFFCMRGSRASRNQWLHQPVVAMVPDLCVREWRAPSISEQQRGGRKISQAEIARLEIPVCRQVVNPQCYEQTWFIYPLSSHFHLCLLWGHTWGKFILQAFSSFFSVIFQPFFNTSNTWSFQ